MKNSLPTATENIMNCGMHRRNIIQRKISKMPLAQIFFVGAGDISSIYHIKLYLSTAKKLFKKTVDKS